MPFMRQDARSEGFQARAESRLKDLGLRMTQPRRAMLAVLERADRPMRPQEIIDQAGQAADAATVHRFMRLLEELGLIHRIASAEGWMRCTLAESSADGHDEAGMEHLLCRTCGRVQEVPLSGRLLELARTSAQQAGFSASAVSLEITGTCSACD